ncbi:hypothetical protein DRN86_02855 [Candidatus Geothermarchaeota archaeon]|nr:MAG: hypothetical protein DRN86_02855 [Candidatus Geothermarchaeota archaeon]
MGFWIRRILMNAVELSFDSREALQPNKNGIPDFLLVFSQILKSYLLKRQKFIDLKRTFLSERW